MRRTFQWGLARLRFVVTLASAAWASTASCATPAPANTWSEVVAATDALSRFRACTAFALHASADQITEAAARLNALPPEARQRAAFWLGQGFAQRHPVAALKFIDALQPGGHPEHAPLHAGTFAGLGLSAPDLAIPMLTDFQKGERRHFDAVQAFFEALATHHPERVVDLLERYPAAALGLFRYDNAFSAKLLKTNPEQALTLVLQHGPAENRQPEAWTSMIPITLIPSMIATWAQRDPARALAWTEQHLDGDTRRQAAAMIFNNVSEQPEHLAFVRSVAFSTKHPFHEEARDRYENSLNRLPMDQLWARLRQDNWAILPYQSASSLGEHLATLPPEEVRDALREHPLPASANPSQIAPLLEAWANVAPAAALAWARNLHDGPTRDRTLINLLPTLFETAPELAATTYAALPRDASREQLSATIAVQFARSDIEGGFAFAQALAVPEERSRALKALGDFAAKHHPEPYAKLLSLNFESPAKAPGQARAFAAQWSRHDPGAALAWLRDQPHDPDFGWRYDGTLDRAARYAPDKLISIIQQKPHSPSRTAFIAGLAREQALRRPEDVSALIATLPTDHERAGLGAETLRAIAKNDPAHAASLVASGTFGPLDIRQLNAIAEVWSDRSATDAARWFNTLPSEYRASGQVASRIAGDFGRQDPESAVAWISTLPPNSRAREIAVRNIAAVLAEHYPLRAWALALAAPASVRVEQVARTYRDLRQTNRSLAERLLNQTDLPSELRDAVLADTP